MGLIVLVLFAAFVVWLFTVSGPPAEVPPPPRDFSFCEQVNAGLAVTGGGGQIAPVCGNKPYPDAPGPGEDEPDSG